MIKKVLAFIKENHMLQAGDKIVAGISGGADSVCLLFILLQIRKSIPFELTVVHVNHRIRKEAGEDAAFVEELCRKWACPFCLVEEDVEGYAAKRRISTEEAGRLIRYRAFEQALEDMGAPEGKIAVAHNQNDNAETVLFNLMRGSGLAGLSGICPVRGRVIRPLLCVSRDEIEGFLAENQLSYCIDQTNNEDTYTRNKIRRHILAYAQEEICERAVPHIYDASVIMREAQDYISGQAGEALERCAELCEGRVLFDVSMYRKEEPFLQKQMLLLAIEKLAGGRKDISSAHIHALNGLFHRESNGRLDLPYGLRAYREYGRVRLAAEKGSRLRKPEEAGGSDAAEPAGTGKPIARELAIPGTTRCPGGAEIICSVFPWKKSLNIPEKTYTKWFDYDKIDKSLVLRTRQTGDYMVTCRGGGSKTLKAYLIGEKIPRAKRDLIPVIADGSHIVWAVGLRISEYYKIGQQTKTVLQIQVAGGTSDGGENQSIADRGRG